LVIVVYVFKASPRRVEAKKKSGHPGRLTKKSATERLEKGRARGNQAAPAATTIPIGFSSAGWRSTPTWTTFDLNGSGSAGGSWGGRTQRGAAGQESDMGGGGTQRGAAGQESE
jgi:hypothetical protein